MRRFGIAGNMRDLVRVKLLICVLFAFYAIAGVHREEEEVAVALELSGDLHFFGGEMREVSCGIATVRVGEQIAVFLLRSVFGDQHWWNSS